MPDLQISGQTLDSLRSLDGTELAERNPGFFDRDQSWQSRLGTVRAQQPIQFDATPPGSAGVLAGPSKPPTPPDSTTPGSAGVLAGPSKPPTRQDATSPGSAGVLAGPVTQIKQLFSPLLGQLPETLRTSFLARFQPLFDIAPASVLLAEIDRWLQANQADLLPAVVDHWQAAFQPLTAPPEMPAKPEPLPAATIAAPTAVQRRTEATSLDLSFSDADEVYIDTAGVVLLWPFLGRFFERLDLITENRFQDDAAVQRAIGLLHYLATEETEPPEYRLPLAKVLCGLELTPPPYGIDFVDRQVERENNTGLPDQLKAGIENLSGLAMDDVRVHYNSSKPAALQALAYTQGTEIHVGPGQERHVPHEAWHVVQQKEGRVRATLQAKGIAINDNHGLEREAEVMGKEARHRQERMNAQLADHPGTLNDCMVQRLCNNCKKDQEQRRGLLQSKGIIQRYDECRESEPSTDRYHKWLQKRYKRKFPGGRKEYSVTQNGSWNFIDIADVNDDEVYEIKSENQGADTATAEAQYYVNLLNGDEGCAGEWSLGRKFDYVWVTEGGGEKITGWCAQEGAILYKVEDIALTSSESESEESEESMEY